MNLHELLKIFEEYEQDKKHDKTLIVTAVNDADGSDFEINSIVHNLKTDKIELRR